jgi:hypothetical protein
VVLLLYLQLTINIFMSKYYSFEKRSFDSFQIKCFKISTIKSKYKLRVHLIFWIYGNNLMIGQWTMFQSLQDQFSKILANVIEFFLFFGQTFWESFNTNHEQGFFFSILEGRWVSNLQQEVFAKFGYKLERTLEKI